MWVSGWQVTATKQTAMEHDAYEGGTHRPETAERCWGKQQGIAGQVMSVGGGLRGRAVPTVVTPSVKAGGWVRLEA